MASPLMRRRIQGSDKIGQFLTISQYISEIVRDTAIVAIEIKLVLLYYENRHIIVIPIALYML